MTKLTVIRCAVVDALGHTREGWLIVENGRYHYPVATKDEAIRNAKSVAAIRCQPESIVHVIEDKTLQEVLLCGGKQSTF